MLPVTDPCRMLDAMALAATLAAQPDVSGNTQHRVQRQTRGGDGQKRRLVAINPGRAAEPIGLCDRTQAPADPGRTGFQAPAGSAVQHQTRKITDPPCSLARACEVGHADGRDESVPAPGGLRPRQLICRSAALGRVKGLLRGSEDGERRRDRALALQRGAPVRRADDALVERTARRGFCFATQDQSMEVTTIARRGSAARGITPTRWPRRQPASS